MSSGQGVRQRKAQPGVHEQQQGADVAGSGRRIAMLVLGDIGRSPRMQYHAVSLARAGYSVDVIGYGGSQPMKEVLQEPNIALRHIHIPPQLTPSARLAFLLLAPVKVVYQVLLLFWMLLVACERPHVILVQNPPAIPTLAVGRACAWLTRARLVIDWHNYGFSILGLRLGTAHPVVRLSKWLECVFGGRAYAHLCVTNAMAADLRDNWRVSGKVAVLHDRAPRHFRHLGVEEIDEASAAWRKAGKLWRRLLRDPQLAALAPGCDALLTARTAEGAAELRADRPMLIVSSTSWTADEDFSVLLRALALYDEAAGQAVAQLPHLAVVITGKGPLRTHYEAELGQLGLQRVRVATAWLAAEDYAQLLGSADLGVSLHTSSSGLDLPMKVVDMLGCGVPVCAFRFPCISELVTEENGLVFGSARELAQQLQDLALSQRSASDGLYQHLCHGAAEFGRVDWDTNYRQVLDLLQRVG